MWCPRGGAALAPSERAVVDVLFDEAGRLTLEHRHPDGCRTGETVDILLDVTNPGVWMAQCHIAEHHEGGMMFGFHVDDAG